MADSRGISDAELLRGILAGAPVRVALIDRTGRLLLDPDPNPTAPTDVGTPPGANFFDLYGYVPGLRDAVNAAFNGKEVRLTREIGGAMYLGTFKPRRNQAGEIDSVLGVATVIAEGTQAERALAEIQIRERHIFNCNMVGMFYWNEDGVIVDANDAFLAISGYTRDDLSQGLLNWRTMTPPEFRVLDERALEEVYERGVCTQYEKVYVRKDGRRVEVLLAASSMPRADSFGVTFVIDMSERKRDERLALEAQERLSRVIDIVPIVLWAVDVEGMFTLSMGRGLAELGLAPGEVVGRSVYEVYAAVPTVERAIRRALAGEELYERVDVGELSFDCMYTPQRDRAGAVVGVLGVAFDVTDRRRADLEREKLRAQLLRVQKLESLGLLAGGIAHDFNNILTPIMGAASTAMLSIPSDNPAHQDLELVIAASRRASGLIRQMLAYSGKAQVEVRALDLSLHVSEIARLIETTVPKKVELRLELAKQLPAIEADVTQVQQVVMNLVINAAEAIGDHQGTVLVTTGTQRLDAGYVASLFAAEGVVPGDYVFLEVCDTGHGMDDATKEKIFDPFFTTKFTGRGLGLAAVLGIVRSHRGAIKVYSAPGRGTTFKVFFPALAQPARQEQQAAVAQFRGEGLVLVVDDDRGVRATASRILKRFGFTVIDAEDGLAGVEVFQANAERVVLVILDITMPKMNGEKTLRAIREIRADVPVILTSGYNEMDATRKFVSRGLAGFLEKPFTPADLAGKLATVMTPDSHGRTG